VVDNRYLWAVKHGVAPAYPAIDAVPMTDPAAMGAQ
jgi:photosynthetic reaction center M subunit